MSDDNQTEKTSAEDAPDAFYRAYCNTEQTWVGGSSGDQVVAQNRADHHKRQTGHSVEVRTN